MTRAQCIGEPVSWLRIERYVVDALPDEAAREVRAHLERCAVCRACAEEARVPREMPPLPAIAPRVRTRSLARPWPRRLALVTSTLAAAAALVFAIRPDGPRDPVVPAPDVRVRGGDLALVIIREHQGEIVENPEVFEAPDRFRVALTCPPGHDARVRVFVVEGDEASLALEGGGDFRCGNRVMLEGAFRITGGGDASICAVFGELPSGVEGAALARFIRSGARGTVCRTMQGEP